MPDLRVRHLSWCLVHNGRTGRPDPLYSCAARIGLTQTAARSDKLMRKDNALALTNTIYQDPRGDYFTRLNPQRARNHAGRQLEAIGYLVTLDQES